MRALATPARRRSPRGGDCEEPRLWGDPVAPAAPEAQMAPAGVAAPAAVAAPERTLEDLISATWDPLVTGTVTECPMCAGPVTPRWSAGAGVVGGRCGSCATTIE